MGALRRARLSATRFASRHGEFARRVIGAVVARPVLIRVEGFKMYVRLDDWAVGARIVLRRGYEPHVVHAMRPHLTPGTTVVDVGANIGFYTLLAASCVGPSGRVFAFEPDDDNCELIRRSAAVNRLENTIVQSVAVADFDGTIWFGKGVGSNGGVSRDPGPGLREVKAVTLDAFLADEQRVDVVKMDVEGAEGMVLAGMMGLLRTHRPVVFTEFQPLTLAESGADPRSFLEAFADVDYDLHVIEKQRPISGPRSIDDVLEQAAAGRPDHLDLLARPA